MFGLIEFRHKRSSPLSERTNCWLKKSEKCQYREVFLLIDQYERQTQRKVDDTKFDLVPLNLFELRSLFVFTFFPCLCFEQIAPTAGGDRASILNIGAIKNECGSVAVELNSYRDVGGVAFSPLTLAFVFKREE